ncbi:hypothetical protein [Brevundimonas naejangsanensis]|uniref:hypothetical protein n=1 Tax=Brevundimonas naejangsanensis TaxID=588932 RepID=UPI001F09E1F7|nr:hypothetical protein [Brevundimonas naejangsanensis]
MQAEEQEGDEVEEGRPPHRIDRRQDAGGDDGGDRVGRVVQAVQEVEQQGDADQEDQDQEGVIHDVPTGARPERR